MQTVPAVIKKFVPNSQRGTSMDLLPASGAAVRWTFSVYVRNVKTAEVAHSYVIFETHERDEAAGKGLRMALKLFPRVDGWQRHHIAETSIENIVTTERANVVSDD